MMSEDIVDVEVTGLKELADKLDNIPFKFAQRIQRTALQGAGEVIAAEAMAAAPVASKLAHPDAEPGELRDSIDSFVHLGKDLDTSVVKVGPTYEKGRYSGTQRTWSPGVYGFFVEYGTSKMDARPFMRPAYQVAKDKAVEVYRQIVSNLLNLLVKD